MLSKAWKGVRRWWTSVLAIKIENADLLMSKHSTAVTNQNKNAVWKNITGDTFTRGASVVYDKRYEWGGGAGALSER